MGEGLGGTYKQRSTVKVEHTQQHSMSFSFYTTQSPNAAANNRGLVMEPLVRLASIAQCVEIRAHALSMVVDSQMNPRKWHGGCKTTEVYIVELRGKQ